MWQSGKSPCALMSSKTPSAALGSSCFMHAVSRAMNGLRGGAIGFGSASVGRGGSGEASAEPESCTPDLLRLGAGSSEALAPPAALEPPPAALARSVIWSRTRRSRPSPCETCWSPRSSAKWCAHARMYPDSAGSSSSRPVLRPPPFLNLFIVSHNRRAALSRGGKSELSILRNATRMEACGALAAAPQITRVQLAQRRRVVTPADEYREQARRAHTHTHTKYLYSIRLLFRTDTNGCRSGASVQKQIGVNSPSDRLRPAPLFRFL